MTASLLVGLIFRNYGGDAPVTPSSSEKIKRKSISEAIVESIRGAFVSALNICAFVIFFTVLIRLLFFTGIIGVFSELLSGISGAGGLSKEYIETIMTGIIEMTSGVWSLRDIAGNLGSKLCMAAFILGWAGLSVHCQVLSFIGTCGLSTRTYIFGKFLHGIISAVIIWVISTLLNWDRTVSVYLAHQVSTIAAMDFHRAFSASIAATLIIGVILMLISIKTEIGYGK